MRLTYKLVALAGVFAPAGPWSPGHVGVVRAGQEPEVARSARGGLLAKAGQAQFEVFFFPTGVRVFPLDAAGAPRDASALSGTVTFYHTNSPEPWFTRPIEGQDSLDLVIGMATVPATGAKARFEIAGSSGSVAEFTVPVEYVKTTAVAPSGAPSASPPFVFGPGFYGVGYYQYPGPQAAPVARAAPAVLSYSTPARQSTPSRSSSGSRDWSTGRRFPSSGLLSKPWLRPS